MRAVDFAKLDAREHVACGLAEDDDRVRLDHQEVDVEIGAGVIGERQPRARREREAGFAFERARERAKGLEALGRALFVRRRALDRAMLERVRFKLAFVGQRILRLDRRQLLEHQGGAGEVPRSDRRRRRRDARGERHRRDVRGAGIGEHDRIQVRGIRERYGSADQIRCFARARRERDGAAVRVVEERRDAVLRQEAEDEVVVCFGVLNAILARGLLDAEHLHGRKDATSVRGIGEHQGEDLGRGEILEDAVAASLRDEPERRDDDPLVLRVPGWNRGALGDVAHDAAQLLQEGLVVEVDGDVLTDDSGHVDRRIGREDLDRQLEEGAYRFAQLVALDLEAGADDGCRLRRGGEGEREI